MHYPGQLVWAITDESFWLCIITEADGYEDWNYGVSVIAKLDNYCHIDYLLNPPIHRGLNVVHPASKLLGNEYFELMKQNKELSSVETKIKTPDPDIKKYTINGKII